MLVLCSAREVRVCCVRSLRTRMCTYRCSSSPTPSATPAQSLLLKGDSFMSSTASLCIHSESGDQRVSSVCPNGPGCDCRAGALQCARSKSCQELENADTCYTPHTYRRFSENSEESVAFLGGVGAMKESSMPHYRRRAGALQCARRVEPAMSGARGGWH